MAQNERLVFLEAWSAGERHIGCTASASGYDGSPRFACCTTAEYVRAGSTKTTWRW
jgi:hypothetical protein